jgi:tRNA splicing endonuclease
MKTSLLIEDEKKVRRLVLLGAMEENGKIRLPYLEAAYFAEKGEIEGNAEQFLSLAEKSDPLAPEKYLVLKQLRDTGFIVRCGESADLLRVYKKGIRVGEDRTMYLLRVLRKKDAPDLRSDLKLAGKMRKELVYAFVGEKIEFVKVMRVNFE